MDRILDIGIGKGGRYIARNAANELRVGLDSEFYKLRMLKNRYALPAVCADASGDVLLPFRTSSFDKVEVIFPHDELMVGLCNSDNLWMELKRVLKEAGNITIVCDIPWVGVVGMHIKGEPVYLHNPHYEIAFRAQAHKFSVQMNNLPAAETRKFGTDFSKFAANRQGIVLSTEVYKIKLAKTD